MINNPFTPVFGGKPTVFFGRARIMEAFERAMSNQGSEARALFVTGSRGYGKTALLEQLSMRAKASGRTVVDVGPDNPIGNIMRHLVSFDESTKTVDPEVEVSVLGTGGKVRGGSFSRTVRYDSDDFPFLFLKAFEKGDLQLFLTIDEVQKVPLDDMSVICNAFQMASRKGHDVMMAVAGLPYAYGKVIRHDGCTFLRRGEREDLGPLSAAEVSEAFENVIGGIGGIDLEHDALDELVQCSKGHPYVVQLEGYHLVEAVSAKGQRVYSVGVRDVRDVMPSVISSYERHALRPLLDEMPRVEIDYLKAMAGVLDSDRIARTGDIAKALGRKQGQTSAAREYLISNGIVIAPRQGELMFAIPYLADFLTRNADFGRSGLDAVREWKM